jgi:hypothetical protein
MHIIEQFNGGIYDTIIASDERFMDLNEDSTNGKEEPQKDKNQGKNKK